MDILANLLKKNDRHQETGQIHAGIVAERNLRDSEKKQSAYLSGDRCGCCCCRSRRWIIGGLSADPDSDIAHLLTRQVMPSQPQMAAKAVEAPVPQAQPSSSWAVTGPVVAAGKTKATSVLQTSGKVVASPATCRQQEQSVLPLRLLHGKQLQ